MITLTLIPGSHSVAVTGVDGDQIIGRTVVSYGEQESRFGEAQDLGAKLASTISTDASTKCPDCIAVRIPAGGETFTEPVIANSANRKRLQDCTPLAPLHIPATLWLLEVCDATFPETPAVLVFESAFFVSLPERESRYAMDIEEQRRQRIRRFGYHGLFHECAAMTVHREMQRPLHTIPSLRIVSVCLEPRPEVAGIRGLQAMTTSGGFTPLEGVPGETTCGQIDPGIPSILAERLGWGPERIDRTLTRESGLKGLLEKPVSFAELFDESPDSGPASRQTARELILHSLTLQAGMAGAALGGVDALVVSGRYHQLADRFLPELRTRLLQPGGHRDSSQIFLHTCDQAIETLVASYAIPILEDLK